MADAFFIGAAAHDASDRILYNAGSGAVPFDPDGTVAQAATQFATIAGARPVGWRLQDPLDIRQDAMAQFPANIDLSSLDGGNGFKLSGVAAYDAIGYSGASAGDVNGDGFADLIVGARGADPHGPDSGAGYVVFGKASGFAANIDLSSLDGSNGFKLSGVAAGDWTGSSVASAGDVNGDGFADLIVGAREANSPGGQSGASYVVFGKASGFAANLDLSSLDGSSGFKLSGAAAGDRTGQSVASAGDVNGDGFADLIVGAFLADPHGHYSGASYVVFGKASGFAANLDLSGLDGSDGFKLSGVAGDDRSGGSVSSAGDVNGDGFADLIVGAPLADSHGADSGASYVVFGRASGIAANIDLSSLDGSNGFKLSGVAAGDRSGYRVSSAGDVDADGFADLIIGAVGADPHGSYSGASYVVFGKALGFGANLDLSSLDGSNGFKLSGAAANDWSGFSVASAGDVNGDGFADLIVSAFRASPHGASSGASYVVFGKASGFAANVELSSLDGSNGFKLSGVAESDESGVSVASAGDVNGDGFGDLIVGAWGADPHGESSGASYVIFGHAPDSAVTRIGTDASQTLAGGAFDDTLSGLGGDDSLFGHAGDDTLDGGAGDDSLLGGDGTDLASYAAATAGVTLDLAITVAQDTGGAGIDTLSGIENLTGSAFADSLRGNGVANRLIGGSGNDTLDGRGGDDTVDGGAGDDRLLGSGGNDMASYAAATAGVTVDLTIAVAQDTGGAGIDTLSSIEGLTGSAFADSLKGDDAANALAGGDRNDRLAGGKGTDHLEGGNGADRLIGGRDADLLVGGKGVDTFGYDTARDSTGRDYDAIVGFDADAEFFDLPVAVTGLDPTISSGRLSEAQFNSDLAAAVSAAALLAHHAVLFTPDQGAHAGETFLIVDANGVAGYQRREDFVFRLDGPVNPGSLSTDRFV